MRYHLLCSSVAGIKDTQSNRLLLKDVLLAALNLDLHVNTVNVIKVLLGELSGRLHNGNTGILGNTTRQNRLSTFKLGRTYGDEAGNWSKFIVDPFEDLSNEVRLGDITLVGLDE